jgi:transcriptional regulator
MYIPAHFKISDEAVLLKFMRENSFAILFTQNGGASGATHLPLLVDEDANGRRCLIGHVARANPQSQQLGGEALAVFHGPHAYVSPTWYGQPNNVPTWNYAAVHVYGQIEVCADAGEKLAILEKMTAFYESTQPKPWRIADIPSDFRDKLLTALTAFRIPITRIEGKWKLNQNKSDAERDGVIRALKDSPREHERETARMMENAIQPAR